MDAWKNQLFFGDNLEILRSGRIPVGSVDLIYRDPPFNSNATCNIREQINLDGTSGRTWVCALWGRTCKGRSYGKSP
jgi:hypothetical protein